MSRLKELRQIFISPAKLIPNLKVDLKTDIKDKNTQREKSWKKFSQNYFNLLAANVDYCYINGLKYDFLKLPKPYICNKNIDLQDIVFKSKVDKPKLIWLPCMDERLQYLTSSRYALSLGIPGCECLEDKSNQVLLADKIVEICLENPTISQVVASSHSACGAVAQAIKQKKNPQTIKEYLFNHTHRKDQILDHASQEFTANFADLISTKLKLANLDVKVRTHHFELEELHSQKIHNAFGAVVNFNAIVNAAELEDELEVPLFNIYANGQKIDEIAGKIELAVNIAGSEHGFGERYFRTETPFVLIFTTNLVKYPERIKDIKMIVKKLNGMTPKTPVIYTIINSNK
jgi:carbonic anhydrase